MQRVELSKQQKKSAILDIKEYFAKERDEEIGDLAAEMLLDFFAEKIGAYYYNRAIGDVQKYMSEKVDDLYGLMV